MERRKRKADLQLLPSDTLDDGDDGKLQDLDNDRQYATHGHECKTDRVDEKV